MSSQKNISFYFFRHGETDWNKQKICQGHSDIPLNETGKQQAKKLQTLLKQFDLERIYSSDLSRAFNTASIVSLDKTPIQKVELLREGFFGEGEGLPLEELERKYPGRLEIYGKGVTSETRDQPIFPKAETPGEVVARIYQALDFIMQDTAATRIGISTHGAALRNFIHELTGPKTTAIMIPNCVCYRISYSPLSKIWDVTGPLS